METTLIIIIIIYTLVAILCISLFVILYIKNKRENTHGKKFKFLEQKEVDKNISYNLHIPKVVYMTHYDLDSIPEYVIDNIKKYCKGYTIEIYNDQKCEDFLYEYYGPDSVSLYKDIKYGAHKADFWRYCILYLKGGYYFDIKTFFTKHIDEIFKIKDSKTWYTVICNNGIYNGIIATPNRNPFIWKAILHIYNCNNKNTDIDYMSNVNKLYKIIQNNISNNNKTVKVGKNILIDDWTCILLKEDCIYNSSNKEHIKDRYGFYCTIKNEYDYIEFKTRYPDYPWKNSKTTADKITKFIKFNKSSYIIEKEYNKPSIAILNNFSFHFECLGYILEMFGDDRYDIHFYQTKDPLGYDIYFKNLYNFKQFTIDHFNNEKEDKYDIIIKLSSDDNIPIIKNTNKLISIIHTYDTFKNSQKCTKYIAMSPLINYNYTNLKPVLKSYFTDTFLPIFYPPIRNNYKRTRQIITMGSEWHSSDQIKKKCELFTYKIVLVRRVPINDDIYMCDKYKNLECLFNLSTDILIKEMIKSSFILIHKKTDRLSGALTFALSYNIPIIIDEYQAKKYNFPCFTYKNNVSELADTINNLTELEYISHVNSLKKYTEMHININREFGRPFKIPRIIHQTISNKNDITDDIRKNILNIKKLNPTWKHILYDEDDRKNFISNNFPELLYLYEKINPEYGPVRSDFFRYLVMFKIGGVYLDIKSSLKSSLDSVLLANDSFVYQSGKRFEWKHPKNLYTPNVFQGYEIMQWFIVSEPNHPFLNIVIHNMIQKLKDPNIYKLSGKLDVLKTTGPIMYTNSIYEILHKFNSRRLEDHDDTFIYTTFDHVSSNKKHYSKLKSPIFKID